MKMSIKCTPGDLDDVRRSFDGKFSHFTVRTGKAQYHLLTLANNSCGLYYAVRIGSDGHPETRRAIEPTTEITCWGKEL